jgi:hypothetical protein
MRNSISGICAARRARPKKQRPRGEQGPNQSETADKELIEYGQQTNGRFTDSSVRLLVHDYCGARSQSNPGPKGARDDRQSGDSSVK